MGELIKNTKAEKLELKLHQRLIALLIGIMEYLSDIFEDIDNDSLISKIIYDERFLIKLKSLLKRKIYNIISK